MVSVPSVNEMKIEITRRLNVYAVSAREYVHHCRALDSIGLRTTSRHSSLNGSVAFDIADVVAHYFKSLCHELTVAHARGLPVVVEPPPACDGVRHMKSLHGTTPESVFDFPSVIEKTLDLLGLDKIHAQLASQVESLVAEGYRVLISKWVRKFGFHNRGFTPVRRGGRIIVDIKSTSYYHQHEVIRDLQQFSTLLQAIGDAVGVEFGGAVEGLVVELNSLTYQQQVIESRTVLAKGSPLEIRCYKNKYDFLFTDKAFDAFIAFAFLYAVESDIDTLSDYLAKAAA